jgi:hypothetical protein
MNVSCTSSVDYFIYRKPSAKAPVIDPGDEAPFLVREGEACLTETVQPASMGIDVLLPAPGEAHGHKATQRASAAQPEDPTCLLELPLAVNEGLATRIRGHLEAGDSATTPYSPTGSGGCTACKQPAPPLAHTQERRAPSRPCGSDTAFPSMPFTPSTASVWERRATSASRAGDAVALCARQYALSGRFDDCLCGTTGAFAGVAGGLAVMPAQTKWDEGQWDIVGRLLDQVRVHLPDTCCTLIADRGEAGHAPGQVLHRSWLALCAARLWRTYAGARFFHGKFERTWKRFDQITLKRGYRWYGTARDGPRGDLGDVCELSVGPRL